MELLTDELRRQLPQIRKIHNPAQEDQWMIYAKFSTRTFYVAEGEQRGADYLLRGMLIAPQLKFASRFQISLSRLEGADWLRNRAGEMKTFDPIVGVLSSAPSPICASLYKQSPENRYGIAWLNQSRVAYACRD